MIKVSAPDRAQILSFFCFDSVDEKTLSKQEMHRYNNPVCKKCTHIQAPGRAHGQTQFV